MERQLPDDPWAFIQASVRGGRLYWTYHVNRRLPGWYIPRQAVIDAVATGQLVDAYPAANDLPSYLILWHTMATTRFTSCWRSILRVIMAEWSPHIVPACTSGKPM
jgi:hypothetical protein